MSDRIALIDGDIIRYKCGFACQYSDYTIIKDGTVIQDSVAGKAAVNKFLKDVDLKEADVQLEKEIIVEPVENCLHSVKVFIRRVMKEVKAKKSYIFLTEGECFRNKIFPEYKANRKDIAKPVLYKDIGDYLKKYYTTKIYPGIEADDALGIAMTTLRDKGRDPVICTIDKDLDTIPGLHYNFDKNQLYNVSSIHAIQHLYKQILTGDSTDNIPGIKGIGPKKATKIIEEVSPGGEDYESRLEARVLEVYADRADEWDQPYIQQFEMVRSLVKILSTKEQMKTALSI